MPDLKLDSYLTSYSKFNDWLIQKRYQELSKYFVGNSCLEMGCAEGSGTEFLLKRFKKVVTVDGSVKAINHIKKKHPTSKLQAINAYFENMNLGYVSFDTLVLAHILEHVDNPLIILKQAKKYAKPGSSIIIDVPNGNSLHRQIGVEMGLLKKCTDLNEADISIGHQRVYLPNTFRLEVENSGLKIKAFGGMFIKVLSNSQTEKVFDSKQLEALFKVGLANPEIAAEMFIVATI